MIIQYSQDEDELIHLALDFDELTSFFGKETIITEQYEILNSKGTIIDTRIINQGTEKVLILSDDFATCTNYQGYSIIAIEQSLFINIQKNHEPKLYYRGDKIDLKPIIETFRNKLDELAR